MRHFKYLILYRFVLIQLPNWGVFKYFKYYLLQSHWVHNIIFNSHVHLDNSFWTYWMYNIFNYSPKHVHKLCIQEVLTHFIYVTYYIKLVETSWTISCTLLDGCLCPKILTFKVKHIKTLTRHLHFFHFFSMYILGKKKSQEMKPGVNSPPNTIKKFLKKHVKKHNYRFIFVFLCTK